jgi:hypothetical protein
MQKSRRRLFTIAGALMAAILLFSLVPTVALAGGSGTTEELDYVDIGDPGSEVGHLLLGWGPVEPATSGGNYGGVDDCRVTWEPGRPDRRIFRAASFLMTVPCGYQATKLELTVLDGLADDSFKVYVGFKKVYSYTGEQTGTEDWITHEIELNSRCSPCRTCRCFRPSRILVTIIATGPAWSSFDTYGQLAVDEARLLGEPCQPCRR